MATASSSSWPSPNTVNPESRSGVIKSIIVAFAAVAVATVVLRVYTRARIVKKFGSDDWVIILATIILIVSAVVNCLVVKYNHIGMHVWDIVTDYGELAEKFDWINQLLYHPVLALTKVSILLFYQRLSANRTFHIWIYSFIIFNIAFSFSITIADLFQCTPLTYVYDKSIADGKCIDQITFFIVSGSLNILTDFAVLALPIPMLWEARICSRQKIALTVVFSLGAFVCAAGIARLHALIVVFVLPNEDPTWNFGFIWSSVENSVAITCASIPSLQPLFMLYFPRFLGSSIASRYYPKQSTKNDWRSGGGSRSYALGTIREGPAYQIFQGGAELQLHHNTIKGGFRKGNESEDSILTEAGIIRTTDVRVDVEEVASSLHSCEIEGRKKG